MMTTTAQGDSVLFHGKVEKIGADGSSLPRSVFLTPSALLVSLPAGGVTRTITLTNMIELEISERGTGSSFRCTVRARNEPVLILDFTNHNDITLFTDAVRGVASHVRIIKTSGNGDNLRERHISLDVPRAGTRGVRFVEPPEFSRPNSSPAVSSFALGTGNSSNSYNSNSNSYTNNTAIHHRISSPSFSVAPTEPLEMVGTSTREPQRVGLFDAASDTHISPFRRESFLYSLGSPNENNASMQINRSNNNDDDGGGGDNSSYRRRETPPYLSNNNSVLYENDITRPLSQQQSPTSWTRSLQSPGRTRLQEDSLNELRAQRESTTSVQQRLTTELELREQTIGKLKDELHEKNAFIDDLKSALRSQESVFQEMLKTTEQLRLVEGSKNQMEKQVELLRAEVKHLENLLKQKEESHTKEMATQLAELHESHSKEVESLKEAFTQYDTQITEYVENLEKEKDREARNWNEKERLLQKQIKSQQDEIAELVSALASQPDNNSSNTLHLPAEENGSTGWKSTHGLLSSHEKRETPRRSRQTTPAAFTTPALEFRLASLEEELARNRLREKVGRYAKTRRRTLQSSSFVKRRDDENDYDDDDDDDDKNNCNTNKDDSYDDDMKSEHVDHRNTDANSRLLSPESSSRRFLTPNVGAVTKGEENSSLALTPGNSRGIRNRAIL